MHLFNTPPGWPPPPTPEWRPPPGWRPDPSWPPAPSGWKFWVNERGGRTLGPAGTYGSVGRGKLAVGGAVAGVAFLALLGAVAGDPEPGTPLAQPAPAVTVTVTQQGTATTAPPATVTAPPATVTMPRATVTVRPKPLPRATVTATVTRPAPIAGTIPPAEPEDSSSDVYYDNCSEVRAAGAAPIRRGEPGYGSHLDRDNDGIACE
jgi:excalibur calcium-binding domain-containing protein